jgi:uncharacterized protein YktB (UPF0637 family)
LQKKQLERFRDVKKAEFLIGLQLPFDDTRVTDGDKFIKTVKDTYDKLIPLYRIALQSRITK